MSDKFVGIEIRRQNKFGKIDPIITEMVWINRFMVLYFNLEPDGFGTYFRVGTVVFHSTFSYAQLRAALDL